MSGCRVNMFVMPVQVFIVFTGASYSFEMLLQKKPFGVHEQFIPDNVKVTYISIITDQTLENTKKKLKLKLKLLVACANYKGWHYL